MQGSSIVEINII